MDIRQDFSSRYNPTTLVFLLLMSAAFTYSAKADLPFCSDVFTNAVQTHGQKGNFIKFGFDARLSNPSDVQLHIPTVEHNPWSGRKSCGAVHCLAGGYPVPKLWIEDFRNTNSTVRYLVAPKSTLYLENTDIGEIDIREYATAEFSSSQNFFVIDRLFIGHKGTLRLREGSYWVRNLRMEVESRIEVIGSGQVNLFVQNSLDIPFKALINTNTKDPSRLTIYDESSSHFHVGSTTYAFIVTENEFILSHGAKIYGGLVGQYIYLESASEVIYDPEGAQAISILRLCRN